MNKVKCFVMEIFDFPLSFLTFSFCCWMILPLETFLFISLIRCGSLRCNAKATTKVKNDWLRENLIFQFVNIHGASSKTGIFKTHLSIFSALEARRSCYMSIWEPWKELYEKMKWKRSKKRSRHTLQLKENGFHINPFNSTNTSFRSFHTLDGPRWTL